MKMTADEFNEKYPVGTPVIYHSVLPGQPGADSNPPLGTKTRTPAWELCDGTAVVSIDGRPGGRALSHIEAFTLPAPSGLHSGEGIMVTLDAIVEEQQESESIRCPHCQHVQDLDEMADYDEIVTLWGASNGPAVTEVECEECDESFLVREVVVRTYDTAKVGEGFDV